MKQEHIAKVHIDAEGKLCVTPTTESFSFIYRAGMEVCWNESDKYLYSPIPREWTYLQWFLQIISAAKGEYHCSLLLTPQTEWNNIPADVKTEILSSVQSQFA